MSPGDHPERPLLEVDHLEVKLPIRSTAFGRLAGHISAVDDVSFLLAEGETLGVVGESGCGKTTLIRAIARLTNPTAGSISFRGQDITTKSRRGLRGYRREAQMVFQDSHTSLNPRKRVGDIVYAAARLRDKSRSDVGDLLERLGLSRSDANRYPREFSGGQRQRIGIARALAADPSLLLLDEPVSALDVSIQAQIINLLDDLQAERRLSYVVVAHDLQVVRHISRRILVVYLGKAVEQAPAEQLYQRPMHPYTAALIDAVPVPDPTARRTRRKLTGELPSPLNPPKGCRFHTRCPRASDRCRVEEPPLATFAEGHTVACHHPLNVSAAEMAGATRAAESPNSTPAQLSLSPVADRKGTDAAVVR